MELFKVLLEEAREPLAILGLIAIGLMHSSDLNVVSTVVGALAGIVVGSGLKKNAQ